MEKSFLWDADTYDKVTDNLEEWATIIIKSRKWSGRETILDAGCGSGRVTKVLCKVTDGLVYAVDNDPQMIIKAKNNLHQTKNVKIFQSDLTALDSATFPIKFDIIFSNAVLHWIDDHYKVFKNFHKLLKEKYGDLLIQCGGNGNLQNIISVFNIVRDLAIFKPYFSDFKNPWNFAKPENINSILTELGYKGITVYLMDAPVTFKDKESYLAYLKTVVLGPYLKHLPSQQLKDSFLTEIANHIEKNNPHLMWKLDYVRLNIMATT